MLKVTEIPSEDIGSALERMVHTVREDEDPEELKVYRALFKKHVPFNLRGYLVGHMIKALVAGESTVPAARTPAPRTSGQRTSAPPTSAPPTPGPRPHERRAEAPRRRRREAEPAPAANGLRRLFVSVGRNRRVRPEDLTSLISAAVAVERSQFGAIRNSRQLLVHRGAGRGGGGDHRRTLRHQLQGPPDHGGLRPQQELTLAPRRAVRHRARSGTSFA